MRVQFYPKANKGKYDMMEVSQFNSSKEICTYLKKKYKLSDEDIKKIITTSEQCTRFFDIREGKLFMG